MKIITEKNIFANGVMLSLRTGIWSATGKLESDKFSVQDESLREDQIKAIFDLLDDKSLIEKMVSLRNKARTYIMKKSISSIDRGLFFVPKSDIIEIDKQLKQYKKSIFSLANELVETFEEKKKAYKKKHPNLYNESNYPSQEKLKNKIYFEWIFRVFEPPSADLLPSKLYQEELLKFKKDIVEMKESTTNMVKDEIVKRLKSLNDQVKNEDKNIHKASLNAVEKLISNYEKLWSGFIDDKTLKNCVKELKKSFALLDIEERKDDTFKDEVKDMISKTANVLNNSKRFRRSIEL